ncbi:putative NADP(+)-dependent dehydrogenase [Aspergillus ellipticus CBS 707.79]|uniref:Putative NADP(+)-dependent dehydrogenase n=1 Tax=Aspergillus ellipticus CBS 707.79 TaxID=1448320 RepID=A0A319CPW8_9EURO|nr:putative NADP(+)-dependent dehydrogenase [Aspergillus ellipticus CBS 707.79]
MAPPLPSLTPTWHNTSYPSISPTRPDLSAANKTIIIITGAGSGIGRATAVSFSRAGAQKIHLIGRTPSKLQETQALLTCASTIHLCSVTDAAAVTSLASEISSWDILILAAGYLSGPATIANSNADDWWGSFETNVRGAYNPMQALLPKAHTSHATIIALTAVTTFPAKALPGLSAYISSKLALHMVIEFVAAENPNVTAVALHPGMVETEIFAKSGGDKERLPMDDISLPADFMVWLASPEAGFLSGRQVWANWDVEELKDKKEEILGGVDLTAGVYGWPFHS